MHARLRTSVAFIAGTIASLALAQTPPAARVEPAAPDVSHEPLVVEMLKTVVRYDAAGTGSKTVHARARIQTEAGVQQLGQLVFDYTSDNERLTFSGRVIGPDGTATAIPESAIQDMSSPVSRMAPMYSDTRQKHVVVPGLRPGYTLEYDVAIDRFAAVAPNQFWLTYDFEHRAIVEAEELSIDVPSATYVNVKSKPDVSPEVVETNGRRVHAWKTSHLQRDESEEPAKGGRHARDEEAVPAVQIGTFRSWNEIGQWYATLEKDRRVPDAALRSKVEAITKDATGDMQKLQAIYDFVAKDFRYVSLSFGIGRYQPHAAPEVFGNRYGDCKDKHTLLAAMAQAAGLDARAALTSIGRKIDETFPSPAQFDHVISSVRVGTEEVWLDTTTELAPFRMLLEPVRGKTALVVNPEGQSELKTVPKAPAVPNTFVTKLDGTISELGTLEADVVLTFRGDAEVFSRLAVRAIPQEKRKSMVQLVAATLGYFSELSQVEISDVTDTARPVEYRFHLTKPNHLNRFQSDPQLAWPLGANLLSSPDETDGRKTFDLDASRVEYHARLRMPARFQAQLPLPVEQKRDFGEYVSRYAFVDGTLAADRVLDVTALELPVGRLSEFKAFRRTVVGDADQQVRIKVGEGIQAEALAESKTDELLDAAKAAFDNGKIRESIDLYERVVRAEPEHKSAYNDLGRAYLASGDLASAEKALRKATEVDPFSPYAFNNLGRVLVAQRRYDDAERALRKQLEIDPLDPWARANLGDMLIKQEKFQAAEPEIEKAIAVTPKNPNLYVALGRTQLHLKKVDEARTSFARAIEASPTPPIWNGIAFSMAEESADLDRAKEYAESAVSSVSAQLRTVRLESASPRELGLVSLLGACWDTLGWVHFRMGHLATATTYLTSAWQLSEHEVVADHLGQARQRAGDKEQAVQYYAYAALAPQPETDARKHLASVVGEAKVDAYLSDHRGRAGALRTFEVPIVAGAGEATFFVVLAPGPVVDGVRFVSGNESLKPAAVELKKIRFNQDFPDRSDARIIRRGILSCPRAIVDGDPPKPGPAGSASQLPPKPTRAARKCLFVLMPTDQGSGTEEAQNDNDDSGSE